MNIDIKLKVSDIIDYLKKEVSESDLKSVDLDSMFKKANKSKRKEENDAVLSDTDILNFLKYLGTS